MTLATLKFSAETATLMASFGVDAKALTGLLSLGASRGDSLRFAARGPDARRAGCRGGLGLAASFFGAKERAFL